MGGSGGSFDPGRIRSHIRDLESKVDDVAYEADVAQLLGGVLADANDRDTQAVQTHLAVIKQAIERDTAGFVDLLFGGSVSKNTYVEGISDVDALVVLNESELGSKTPLEVRDHFISQLRERLPDTEVVADGFAVAVKYADCLVELVPVRRHGDDFLLPNHDCSSWSRVRPHAFTDALTATNKAQNGKVIPTIKLAKLALSEMPDGRRPRGYHLEALAIDAFSGYAGPPTPKDMLIHLFSQASQRVLRPIADRTGQSRNVDDHLGSSGSVERLILSDSLGRVARRLRNADGAHDVEQWKRALGVE